MRLVRCCGSLMKENRTAIAREEKSAPIALKDPSVRSTLLIILRPPDRRAATNRKRAQERDAGSPNARYMKIQAIISTIEQMMNIRNLQFSDLALRFSE